MSDIDASKIIKWMFAIIWLLMILLWIYTFASNITDTAVLCLIILTSGMTMALTIKYLSWYMNG